MHHAPIWTMMMMCQQSSSVLMCFVQIGVQMHAVIRQTWSKEGERRHAAHALEKRSKQMSLTPSLTRATNNDFLHNPQKFSCSTHETETHHQASLSRCLTAHACSSYQRRNVIPSTDSAEFVVYRQDKPSTHRAWSMSSHRKRNIMEMEGSKIFF